MTIRPLPAIGVPAFVALAVLTACVGRHRQSELVLAHEVHLGPRAVDINPRLVFRTVNDASALLLEVPGLRMNSGGTRIISASGTEVAVGGYLMTVPPSRKVDLDDVTVVERGGRTFLRLSSRELQGTKRQFTFSGVTLWCDEAVTAGRLVWFSYDSSRATDGSAWPEALK